MTDMPTSSGDLRPPLGEPKVAPATRAHPLLYLVLMLLVANLVLTIWYGARLRNLPSLPGTAASSAVRTLPDSLTSSERDRLFERFQTAFNNRDVNALYDLLDPVARVQITKEALAGQIDKMTLFGRIPEGVYSHHSFLGSNGGLDSFELVYQIRLTSTQFQAGTLTFSLTVPADGRYQVIGFRINGK